jgi:hypothetical protein
MKSVLYLTFLTVSQMIAAQGAPSSYPANEPVLQVPGCGDFKIDGRGTNSAWDLCNWTELKALDGKDALYDSRIKMLYSKSGIYVLFKGEDRTISTNYTEDQEDIYLGDVFEVFFHTDTRYPLYFEYEINPLGAELVLLVPNIDGSFLGWLPWKYGEDRRVLRAVHVEGGSKSPGSAVTGWSAELFFPYELLKPLGNVPPKPGTEWKGNFYRMDYDGGERHSWSWVPISGNFHDFKSFKTLRFE